MLVVCASFPKRQGHQSTGLPLRGCISGRGVRVAFFHQMTTVPNPPFYQSTLPAPPKTE